MAKFELVEVDPATGDADQIIGEGSMAQMEKARAAFYAEAQDDFDTYGQAYPVARIQPAGTATW